MLDTEELHRIRANAEVALGMLTRGIAENATAVQIITMENDLPIDTVKRALIQTHEAAMMLRQVRDEYEMSVIADAFASLAQLED